MSLPSPIVWLVRDLGSIGTFGRTPSERPCPLLLVPCTAPATEYGTVMDSRGGGKPAAIRKPHEPKFNPTPRGNLTRDGGAVGP